MTVDGSERARAQEILRQLGVKLVLSLVVLLVFAGLLTLLLKDQLEVAGIWFVEMLGGPGLTIGFFIPDAFIVPVPHEVLSGFGLLGGMNFWAIVAWATVGSLTGGSVGYLIGAKLGKSAWYIRRMNGRDKDVRVLVRHYGVATVAIGALSPLPYSITCWVAGAGAMRYLTFILVSLLRIPRIAFYLWLIEVGFVTLA